MRNAISAPQRPARSRWIPALLLPGLLLAGNATAQSCAVGETPVAFGFTGGEQTLVVPAGVTSVTVQLSGAQGGNGRSGAGSAGPNSPGGIGGIGGRVRGTLNVTPGAVLSIFVGGQGSQAVNPGGIGEGLDGMGGGATDLRVGGNGLANRVAVAGGGGGGGNAGWSTSSVVPGGDGGSGGGEAGYAGGTVPGGSGPFGGGRGQVGVGGAAGAGCPGFPATAGDALNGNGGDSVNFPGSFAGAGFGGGGGGGAEVGGGGGGAGVGTTGCAQNWNGGGGGGAGGLSSASGLSPPRAFDEASHTGDGSALICLAQSEYTVGGSIAGQTGTVLLELSTTNPSVIQQIVVAAGATAYEFPSTLPAGANWSTSVVSAPAGQLCSFSSSSGSNIAANVTNANVSCVTVVVDVAPATLPGAAVNAAFSQVLSASSANGGTAPYSFTVSAGALPPGLTLDTAGLLSGTPTAAGNFNFTVQASASNGFSGTRAYTVVVDQASQVITAFAATPAAPVFSPGGSFSVSATGGGSGNPVVFASTTPAVCTVSGGTVSTVSAGSCSLTADQAGNANYSAAPQATLNLTISAATQAITNFTATPASPVFSPGGSFTLAATGGPSTSPVVFASASPAVCSVSGSTATTLAAGTCSLTANQAGDANYDAAPEVTLAVTVTQATQAITGFTANPAAPVYSAGGSFVVSASGGASGNPVLFGSTTPAVCTVSGATVAIISAGNCTLTANQAGDANYGAAPQVTLGVAIATAVPNLTWIDDLQRTMGQAAFDLADPGSNSAGAFSFASSNPQVATVSGRTVTLVGDGVTTLVATQAAAGNFQQASISITLTVTDRPDPTTDRSVVSGLQAQVDASVRFANAQQSNIRDRLRQQRHATEGNASSNGLGFNLVNGSGGALSLNAGPAAPSSGWSLPEGWGVWTAGVITVGDRDAVGGSDGFDFLSDGISVGADWRINERFLLGVAGGLGWNDTNFDESRSNLDGDQRSLALYGLWRQGDNLFLDGTLGWGNLGFDITRWSDIANAQGTATRDGEQVFGSLTLGYDHANAGMSLTSYGRLDASRTRLDAYRESGLGIYDLAYGRQTVENSSLAVGMEGSYLVQTRWGRVRPYWMAEYRDAFEDGSEVALNYVVSPVATDYRLSLNSYGSNVLMYGGGVDVDVTAGWRVSFLLRREEASSQGSNTSFGFLLTYSPQARAPMTVAVDADGAPLAQAESDGPVETGR